jgi:hypothetical protein
MINCLNRRFQIKKLADPEIVAMIIAFIKC